MDGRAAHYTLLLAVVLGTASAVHYVTPGQHGLRVSDRKARSLHQPFSKHGHLVRTPDAHVRLHKREARASSNDNSTVMCRWGKWLPELYLLGGPKCATSDLSLQLVRNGIPSSVNISGYSFHDPDLIKQDVAYIGKKESQFFHGWFYLNGGTWNARQAVKDWRHDMPDCPEKGSAFDLNRTLFADYTPLNLALVPPDASVTSRPVTAWGHNLTAVNLPSTLEVFYGELSPRLTFIVMLREPLAQLQSAWYHAEYVLQTVEVNATQLIGDLPLASNFTSELERALDLADRGTITLWLWYAFFGKQVQAFLARFAAPQFVFIPMYHFLGTGREEVCAAMEERLNFPISCAEVGESINQHDHPALDEELPVSSELRLRFEAFMSPEIQNLVEVLYLAYMEGAHLPALHPQDTNTPLMSEVKDWLVSGW